MKDFKWAQGTSIIQYIVKDIAETLTETVTEFEPWKLEYPVSGDIQQLAIISNTTKQGAHVYIKLEKPDNVMNYMLITVGTKLNEQGNDIDDEISSIPARYAWYRDSEDVKLFNWVPIQYWISYSNDFINIVVQGDPSIDIHPYKNYLISWAYMGALESFENSDRDDYHNFGITVGADKFFEPDEMPDKYGNRTATGVTDIAMLGTRSNTPFQAHQPKFSTINEFADKHYITSSAWTHKYHMSEIIITHAYDRERGKLQNVLIGDRSAIFHLDTLVIDKGKPEEKQYVMFNINSPYSMLNNGANTLYGIAIRKF